MKDLTATVAIFSLACCTNHAVAAEQAHAPERLPLPAEVTAYVRSHWYEIYSRRFSGYAKDPSAQATLISVDDVTCGYYYATPSCEFKVVFRSAAGAVLEERLEDTFGWDKTDNLTSVVVFYHERR